MEMTEFERKRYEANEHASDFAPETALKAVYDLMQSGQMPNVSHILVVVVSSDDDIDTVDVHQAGKLTTLAGEGALMRAVRMLHGD